MAVYKQFKSYEFFNIRAPKSVRFVQNRQIPPIYGGIVFDLPYYYPL